MQQTVLITGCSSGIGRAAAHMFLEADWRVYATARNPADIETLGERGCQIATLDVTDDDDIDRVVDRIEDESGSVSCLVNNAGFGQFGAIEDIPTSQVHRQFDVNLYGPHRLIRAVLPKMRENEAGTIINISSVAGQVSFPTGGVYAGSKAALEAMSDALRNEVAPYDIDVVIIEPGPVETAFPDRAAREFQDETKENSIADDTQQIERSGAYESLYELLTDTKLVGGGGFGAVSAERVAEDILDAASSTSPQPRYQTGATARVGVLARFVPSTWRDTLYQKLQSL
ncbi:SDR family oxidoreductase [Haloquadratum walsbyi]|jgi:NAD(P)-dependent dehydrogenase (short-subunit alcohol dehydrogenase family)|uniref:Probable oxidoreductase (Short-chain dehydrogenase family) n=1 Tax=Haloquadratum walsbyi (strain DSM 16790 / HBSQ001) TaxID=362976 RepID=Q18KT0_HALWD|nr:SDR family oxidoreductase [Haloquadratum walsbyi]CAJ51364.1 probable oxidoreductase (short-chain dehydrogenase family) [Haloquadratum walsbyi DSM 16790]